MMQRKQCYRFGVEVNLNSEQDIDDAMSCATEMKHLVMSKKLPYAVHLPSPNRLTADELKRTVKWLKGFGGCYAVTHGHTAAGKIDTQEEFIQLLKESSQVLSVFSGINVCIENTPIPVLNGGEINYKLRAGMLAGDLRDLAERSGCGVLVDTEHLLQTIYTVRNWSIHEISLANGRDEEHLSRYGFVVRSGKLLCDRRRLKDLTLERQLALIGARRYHITGTSGDSLFPHCEIYDEPFHRYLISTVLTMRPHSITVESCFKEGSLEYDPEVSLRSLRQVAKMIRTATCKKTGQQYQV